MTSFIRVRKIFLALTLMLIVNFIASGQVELIAAMLIGYALAGFYIISTAMRLSSIAQQKSAFAKRQMLFGLVMRILMIFVVFAFAIKISEKIFFTMVICFLTFYLLMQLGLIMHSYNSAYNDDVNEK